MPSVVESRVVKFIRKGASGEKGAALRGPQAWSDCAVGYAFQSGASGERFQDVVIYNGNCYYCKTSHSKTVDSYPLGQQSEEEDLWQLGDNIGLVATKILLATYALVENLGVAAIEMKDSNGNILLQAKDGAVTCKIGNFEHINVTNSTIKHLKLEGSTKVDYVKEEDIPDSSILDVRNVSRIRIGNQALIPLYIPALTVQGENTEEEMEGHTLEIMLMPSVFTRSSSKRVILFEDGIIDYMASGTSSCEIFDKITIGDIEENLITAGGYIKMQYCDGRWEVIQKNGNILITKD